MRPILRTRHRKGFRLGGNLRSSTFGVPAFHSPEATAARRNGRT